MPQAVQATYVAASDRPQPTTFLDQIGIPTPLAFGFLGLLFFMIGDGVESGYLSPYLVSRGVTEQQVALMFTIYGIVLAISAWCSGARHGARRSPLVAAARRLVDNMGNNQG